MKAGDIYKKIRKIYFRHLIWPLFPIIMSVAFLIMVPFEEILYPVRVNSMDEVVEAVNNGEKYLELSLSRLTYSGYNYMRDTDVHGKYYYELTGEGDKCVFVLLEPSKANEKATKLSDVTIRVKVTETNGIFDNMLSMFAGNINWTEEGVSGMTEDYVLSQVDYHYRVYFILLVVLLVTFAYGLIIFAYNILIALVPRLCPKLLYAKYYFKSHKTKGMDKFVEHLSRELEAAKVCQGNMYITDHFIINMDNMDIDVVPVNKIMMVYEHSTLKSFMGIHLKVSYTLHLKCSKLICFHAPRKNIDDVNCILDYIRENEPDILVGYTSDNKQLMRGIIKKRTGWFMK